MHHLDPEIIKKKIIYMSEKYLSKLNAKIARKLAHEKQIKKRKTPSDIGHLKLIVSKMLKKHIKSQHKSI